MGCLNGRYVLWCESKYSLIDYSRYFPQEYTSFTVEKANLLNKRAKLASIAHYHDSVANLDPSARYRHRHDISRFVNLPLQGQFAMVVSFIVLIFFYYRSNLHIV